MTQEFFARALEKATFERLRSRPRPGSGPTCAPASTASRPTSARPPGGSSGAAARRSLSLDFAGAEERAAPPWRPARDLDVEEYFHREWVRRALRPRRRGPARRVRADRQARCTSGSSSATTSKPAGEGAAGGRPTPSWPPSTAHRRDPGDELPGRRPARASAGSCWSRSASSPPARRSSAPRRGRSWGSTRDEPADAALAPDAAPPGCARWPWRRRAAARSLRHSRTRSSRRSAAAAWARSTGPSTGGSTARSRSRSSRSPARGRCRRRPPGWREARILARLEHPGIVPVHDAGLLPDGRAFYAMKRVRGRRLDECARTALPPRAPPRLRSASARPSPSPTPTASSTATSSPRTSWSGPSARCW